jgi:hypothetical protein
LTKWAYEKFGELTMVEYWCKLSEIRDKLIESITEEPANWMCIRLLGEGDNRLLSGNDLILMSFDQDFFAPVSEQLDIDFSWLVRANSNEQMDAIVRQVNSASRAKSISIRHPLISSEHNWVAGIVASCDEAVVYARYEGDDVLVRCQNGVSPTAQRLQCK